MKIPVTFDGKVIGEATVVRESEEGVYADIVVTEAFYAELLKRGSTDGVSMAIEIGSIVDTK